MMSRGYIYLLLLDRAGQVGRSVEHSEGRCEESVMSILRFLCGSPRPCWLRTAPFWPRWQALSCVLTACRVLWGPINRVVFVTNMSNRISLLHVVLLLFGGRMRPRAKTSSREQLVITVISYYVWYTVSVFEKLDVDMFRIIISLFIIAYLWRWHGLTFCLFMLVLVCSCKYSAWLKKLKFLN
jgi:hypothetical protein